MSPQPRKPIDQADSILLEQPRQLLDFLLRGARPREDWGVGIETEKLVVDRQTGEAAGYERIRELLARLDGVGGWSGMYEGDKLLGLQGKRSSITLEPGGQLELSGKFCCDIHCSWRDMSRYRQYILSMGEELGLLFLGLGVQPFTPLEQIPWLPKKRYGIMGPYMLKTGDMGQRMMKQSAGTQVNLDFGDEQDCMRKIRAVQWLSPVSYALFANSPLLEGKPSGWLSTRGEIWSRTDADRCGLILDLLRLDAGLQDYVDYALDVPMYFIVRNGEYINLTTQRLTFRRYLQEGFGKERATLGDWDLHLSTLFPEVRLRPQVEVRSADSLPPSLAAAVAAFYKGLLYTDSGLAMVESLFAELSSAEFVEIYRHSWHQGLRTAFRSGTLQEVAAQLLKSARHSLEEQFQCGRSGADEGCFLDPLEELVASGETLAERLLARWQGDRREKLQVLADHCGYTNNVV